MLKIIILYNNIIMDFLKKTMDNSKENFEKSFSKAEDNISSSIGTSIKSIESKSIGTSIPSLKPPSPLESIEKSASNLESGIAEGSKSIMGNIGISSNPISQFFQTNWLSILFWIGIVLLVAFLGFNLFEYLGKMVDSTNKVLDPIISKLGNLTADTSKQAINVSSDGAKGLIDVGQKVTTGGIDLLQKQINKPKDGVNDENNDEDSSPSPSNETDVDDKTDKDVKDTSIESKKSLPDVVEVDDPDPYLAESNVQSNTVSGKTGKSGFCYIGTDNGIRTCAPVGKNNACMSGDIFPTNEICVNPDLRY